MGVETTQSMCLHFLSTENKNRSIGPELTTSKTGPIHLSSLVEIAFVDWFTKLLLINVSIYMNI